MADPMNTPPPDPLTDAELERITKWQEGTVKEALRELQVRRAVMADPPPTICPDCKQPPSPWVIFDEEFCNWTCDHCGRAGIGTNGLVAASEREVRRRLALPADAPDATGWPQPGDTVYVGGDCQLYFGPQTVTALRPHPGGLLAVFAEGHEHFVQSCYRTKAEALAMRHADATGEGAPQ